MKENRVIQGIFKVIMIFALIMGLTGISFMGRAKADSFDDAKISFFMASEVNIPYGGKTVLKWEVEDAIAVELQGLEKVPEEMIPLAGSLEVSLTKTTTFTLVAENGIGEKVTRSVTVNVADKELKNAKIKSFTVSDTQIPYGGIVEVKWEVEDAVSVELLGWEKANEEMLPLSGSMKVKLIQTTNFILTAIGESGNKDCLSIKVNVGDIPDKKPSITSFTASKETVAKGELVTLQWTTENVDECRILTDNGIEVLDRPSKGKISITPNKTRTYTLIAIKGNFRDEKSITIYVKGKK
jgi:hypothetical protein